MAQILGLQILCVGILLFGAGCEGGSSLPSSSSSSAALSGEFRESLCFSKICGTYDALTHADFIKIDKREIMFRYVLAIK